MVNNMRSMIGGLAMLAGVAFSESEPVTNGTQIVTNPLFSTQSGVEVVKLSAFVPVKGEYWVQATTNLTEGVWTTLVNSAGQSVFTNKYSNNQMNFAYPKANLPQPLSNHYSFKVLGDTNSIPIPN